ncbi:MAG: HEAT repeat domain-containing protein [Longimicrobiales bacterium]
MTIPDWLLLDVALVEGVALAGAWLVILAHGVRAMYQRSREPQIAEARDAVVGGLLAGSLEERDREKLEPLSRSERVRLFNRVAPNLRGRERGWLGELAEDLGLVEYGQRMSRSRFWWRRLRGARLLTLAGGAGDAVLRLADDPHPLVRSQVAEWCGANPSEHAVATLIGMLGDPSQTSRFAVQDALVRIGTETIEPLRDELARIPVEAADIRSERDVKAAIAGLGVARGIGDSRLTDPLLRLTDHPVPEVRELAYRALGGTGSRDAADRLEQGLEDPDTSARAAAAAALGELEHWPAGPRLARALSDPAWDVRAAAGRALVRLGPPGELLLRRTMKADDSFAADMARHALDTAGVVTRFGGV